MVFKCCVPNCQFSNSSQMMHSFPKDPEFYSKWVCLIGRLDLVDKDQNKVRQNYRVCDIHFCMETKYETCNNRTNIKVNSVPSLYLPGFSELPTLENSVGKYFFKKQQVKV